VSMPSLPSWQKRDRQQGRQSPMAVENEASVSQPTAELTDLEEGVQEVHEELRKATIWQITLTLLAILAICYVAKLVLVTLFTSILIAFILEPLVGFFARIRIPKRGFGSGCVAGFRPVLRPELFFLPASRGLRTSAAQDVR